MNLNVLLSNEETLSGILHENVWEVDCQHLGLLKNVTDNSEQFNYLFPLAQVRRHLFDV